MEEGPGRRGVRPFSENASMGIGNGIEPMASSALRIAPVFIAVLLVVPPPAFAEPIPTNSRSRAAIAQAAPALRQDMAEMGLRFGAPIFVRLFKEEREFEVWVEDGARFRHFRTYPICNYAGTLGPKLKEGDGQSPEGFYFVRPRQLQPWSNFHLSFNLGFPNAYDRGHGRTGSYLMVHGRCVSTGCYAMTNEKIEEIWGWCSRYLTERVLDDNLRHLKTAILEATEKVHSRTNAFAVTYFTYQLLKPEAGE